MSQTRACGRVARRWQRRNAYTTAPPHADFYPLPAATVGERFPIADDAKAAVLAPVPPDRAQFLHCILHGIAQVEADGYAALADLGATPLTRYSINIITAGLGVDINAIAETRRWMGPARYSISQTLEIIKLAFGRRSPPCTVRGRAASHPAREGRSLPTSRPRRR